MLTDSIKLNSLWKGNEGWANTHAQREVFEELYRSFKSISANNVLTYGHLIPKEESDEYFNEVANLSPENPVWKYSESSYKKIPIVELVTELTLTPISPNCNDTYVLLDENGKQIKNIIPYDYSDTGIYNYTLKNYKGAKIPFGVCEWHLDVNSATLTFNNGVPEDVANFHPPKLTFYKYVGPVGERVYIDAALYDVEKVAFTNSIPVVDFTETLKTRLDDIWEGWFNDHGFKGDDLTQGIGLQYNLLTNVVESESGDAVMGWDDNSQSQVVSLLSHKKADNLKVVFASEHIPAGEYTVQVEEKGYSKIAVEDGFVVINSDETGPVSFTVEESESAYAVLLVKDNETSEMELYFPREDVELTVQVPVFVDLKILPPHLKLKTLSSYSDEIIPQYYGPRVADYVIASYEDTVNLRSADFIVYNKDGAYLEDAFNARAGSHVFLRSGTYENNGNELLLNGVLVQGESVLHTTIKNSSLRIRGAAVLEGLNLSETSIIIDTDKVVEIKDCAIGEVEVVNGTLCVRDSSASKITVDEGANLLTYGSHIEELVCDDGFVSVNGSTIKDLYLNRCAAGSVLNTTNITNVHTWDTAAKLDSSYATNFDESIERELYPDEKTIPYYNSFGDRVYAKLPDPFVYVEDTNEIHIKIDNFTIKLDSDGNLYCRFFTSNEINMDSVPETQTEAHYGIHEDSKLYKKAYNYATKQFEYVLDVDGNRIPIDKPVTVDDAIMDLYWSKAGLVNGKVPIDQLPDSVAYGGLSFVGMWSFEDHNGEYPTFEDVSDDFKLNHMSDDAYTDLQKGWFFIVKASHHADENGEVDDPCYPQEAVDGESYTAGDWVIFTGKGSRKVKIGEEIQDKESEVPFTVNLAIKDITSEELAVKAMEGWISEHSDLGLKKSESELTALESSMKGVLVASSTYETVYENNEGQHYAAYIDKSTNSFGIINLATGMGTSYTTTNEGGGLCGAGQIVNKDADAVIYSYEEMRTVVTQVTVPLFKDEVYDVFEKLDRAYSDPVYSRLPEMAPTTGGKNTGWSLEKGGAGKLELSYRTLAEAIRLINEELWNLSPATPASIRNIKVVIDEDSSNLKEEKYIPVGASGILSDFLASAEVSAYDCDESIMIFKQEGVHDQLPLEHEFYINSEDDFTFEILDGNDAVGIFDKDTLSTLFPIDKEGFVVDIQDPYTKYNLGIKGPSKFQSAEVSGLMTFTEQKEYEQDYSICYKLSGLKANPYVPVVDHLMGRSEPLEFTCRRFYDGSDMKIKSCDPANANMADLNAAMSTKIAGIPFLTNSFTLKSNFVIENFISYGALRKTDGVKLTAVVDGVARPEIEIPFVGYLENNLNADKSNTYNLRVVFDYSVGECMNLETGLHTFEITASATSGETILDDVKVFSIEKVNYLKTFPENIVTTDPVVFPILGQGLFDGSNYKQDVEYESCAELALTEEGFRWPAVNYPTKFLTTSDTKKIQTGIQIQDGISINKRYRTMTFKFDLGSIHDLTGLDIKLEYGNDVRPSINKYTGEFNSEIRIEVLPHSSENKCTNFLNANDAIESPFFEAKLTPQEKVLYPGKSDLETRRVTFGRNPIPVSEVYVRIMIVKDSEVAIKNVTIDTSTGC